MPWRCGWPLHFSAKSLQVERSDDLCCTSKTWLSGAVIRRVKASSEWDRTDLKEDVLRSRTSKRVYDVRLFSDKLNMGTVNKLFNSTAHKRAENYCRVSKRSEVTALRTLFRLVYGSGNLYIALVEPRVSDRVILRPNIVNEWRKRLGNIFTSETTSYILLSKSMNAFSTFVASRADVSINMRPVNDACTVQFLSCVSGRRVLPSFPANCLATSVLFTCKCERSHLFPTSMMTIFASAWSRNSVSHFSTLS